MRPKSYFRCKSLLLMIKPLTFCPKGVVLLANLSSQIDNFLDYVKLLDAEPNLLMSSLGREPTFAKNRIKTTKKSL